MEILSQCKLTADLPYRLLWHPDVPYSNWPSWAQSRHDPESPERARKAISKYRGHFNHDWYLRFHHPKLTTAEQIDKKYGGIELEFFAWIHLDLWPNAPKTSKQCQLPSTEIAVHAPARPWFHPEKGYFDPISKCWMQQFDPEAIMRDWIRRMDDAYEEAVERQRTTRSSSHSGTTRTNKRKRESDGKLDDDESESDAESDTESQSNASESTHGSERHEAGSPSKKQKLSDHHYCKHQYAKPWKKMEQQLAAFDAFVRGPSFTHIGMDENDLISANDLWKAYFSRKSRKLRRTPTLTRGLFKRCAAIRFCIKKPDNVIHFVCSRRSINKLMGSPNKV